MLKGATFQMAPSDHRPWFETRIAGLVTLRIWLGVFIHRYNLSLGSIQREWTCGLVKIDQLLLNALQIEGQLLPAARGRRLLGIDLYGD